MLARLPAQLQLLIHITMNYKIIPSLRAGALLTLKAERAAAYGMDNRLVEFVELQRRYDYKVGWIVGKDARGSIGHYKPSDFTGNMNGGAA